MADSIIKVENLVKSFGDHEVLKKIDFEISKGDIFRKACFLPPPMPATLSPRILLAVPSQCLRSVCCRIQKVLYRLSLPPK